MALAVDVSMESSGRDGVRCAAARASGDQLALRCGVGRRGFAARLLRDRHLEHTERRTIGERSREQRHRHVVHRNAKLRFPLELAAVRVSVEDERDGIAADRLLKPARSEKRIDFERLAFDGCGDRRIMQEDDWILRAQPAQRRLELEGFVDRLADELLDDGLAPGSERPLPEPAAESFHAGDADALELTRVAVKQRNPRVGQNLGDVLRLSRFEVVVAENRRNRHAQRRHLLLEHAPSVLLMISIVFGSITIGVVVARKVRANIERLAEHYESMLQLAEDQSRQADAANRMKDEFLATLSHELRTPLNSVLGWARLLASGKLDSSQTAKAIQAIERAGWAQSRLIEDLLDISRIVAGRLQINTRPTTVQPLVEAAVDSLRPAAEAKHITVTLSLDPNADAVTVDPDRVQQVVWNLVSNAIKFTHTDGHVDVAAGVHDGELVITVDDDGIGFPPEVAMHLFERFRQGDSSTTRAYGGLGLGLGIVRHVVELHGGTVTASSAGENAGSHFEVRMPVEPANAPAIAAPFPQPQLPSLRGVSVLVVDDDPQALEFVRSALEQSGAIVVTAGSAREAEARFSREPTDVVLSDLMMPGEDEIGRASGRERVESGG